MLNTNDIMDGWQTAYKILSRNVICNISIYESLQFHPSTHPLTHLSTYLPTHLPIPAAPTWSIGHPWNASFHFSFLILDSRYDSLDEGSAHLKAATYTQT
jgi:hypothetical protein